MSISGYKVFLNRTDEYNTKIYLPISFNSSIDPNELVRASCAFNRVQCILDEYSKQYGSIKINIILSGYDNYNNFRFNTAEPIIVNNKPVNIIVCMVDGMIDIVTDAAGRRFP